jgi:hypothetical protein
MSIAGYTPARSELHRLVNGYQVSQALHVLTLLGIPDRLADGPCSSQDLAALVGAADTNQRMRIQLPRIMRIFRCKESCPS